MQTTTTPANTPAIHRAANVYELVTRARAQRNHARRALVTTLLVAIVAVAVYAALVIGGENLAATIVGGSAVLTVAILLTIRQLHLNSAANYDDRATSESEPLR